MGGTREFSSAALAALPPVAVEDRLVIETEITGPQVDHLGAPPAGQDEDQKQRPVPPSCDGVRDDREEPTGTRRLAAPRQSPNFHHSALHGRKRDEQHDCRLSATIKAMFSGIVSPGTVIGLEGESGAHRFTIAAPALEAPIELGESVAVNGVCLTVAAHHDDQMTVDLMPETLRRSNLGQLASGARVNVERSLRLGDRIGGHFVQGHVDGVAEVVSIRAEEEARVVYFRLADADLARYIVEKGFVAVDGVSLTVVEALADGFSVSLVKTTLALTTLGQAQPGYAANVEIDLFARYLVDRPPAPSLAEVLAAPLS